MDEDEEKKIDESLELEIIEILEGLNHLKGIFEKRGLSIGGMYQDNKKRLTHLERLDEKFHHYHLVRRIYLKLDDLFGEKIYRKVMMFGERDHCSDLYQTGDIAKELFTNPKFSKMVNQFKKEVDAAVKVISNNSLSYYVEQSRNRLSFTSDRTTPVSTNSTDWENILSGNVPTSTVDQRLQWAKDLHIKNSVETRLEAIEKFCKLFAGDIVGCEPWDFVLRALTSAMRDSDPRISSKATDLHVKMFKYATPDSSLDLFLSLITHLKFLFGSNSLTSFAKSTEDRVFLDTVQHFMIISVWSQDLPSYWIQCSHLSKLFDRTFELFTMKFPEHYKSITNPIFNSPFIFISLADPEAKWFSSFVTQSFARQLVIDGEDKKVFFQKLTHFIIVRAPIPEESSPVLKFEHFFSQIIERKELPQNDEIRVFRNAALLQSVTLLGILCKYSEGKFIDRNLAISNLLLHLTRAFSHDARDILSHSTYPTIIKRLVDVLVSICSSEVNETRTILEEYHVDLLLTPLRLLSHHNLNGTKIDFQEDTLEALMGVERILETLIENHCYHSYFVKPDGVKAKSRLSIIVSFIQKLLSDQIQLMESEKTVKRIFFPLLSKIIRSDLILLIKNEMLNNLISPLKRYVDNSNYPQYLIVDTIIDFASTSKGLQKLHDHKLISICTERLLEKYYYEVDVKRVIYLFSQLCALSHGMNSCLRKSFINDMLDDFLLRIHNYDWVPIDELVRTSLPLNGTELLFLMMLSPSFVPVHLTSVPNIANVMDIINQRILFANTQLDELKVIGFKILNHLFVHLDSVILCQKHFKYLDFLYSENSDACIVDEPTQTSSRTLLLTLIGGPHEKRCLKMDVIVKKESRKDFFRILDEPLFEHEKSLLRNVELKKGDQSILAFFNIPRNKFLKTLRVRQQLIRKWERNNLSLFPKGFMQNVTTSEVKLVSDSFLQIGDATMADYAKIIDPKFKSQNFMAMMKKLRNILFSTTFSSDQAKYTRRSSSSEKNIKSKEKYDWFLGFVLLIFQNADQAYVFCHNFWNSPESIFLWYRRGVKSKLKKKKFHPTQKIINAVEGLIQMEFPKISNFFMRTGLSPSFILHRWLRQFFLNILDIDEIHNIFILCLVYGIDYLVYCCVLGLCILVDSVLENRDVCHDFSKDDIWLACMTSGLKKFHIGELLPQLTRLEVKYREFVKKGLEI